MAYLTREVIDKKEWEDFIFSKEPKSFLQSWNWGETNKQIGKDIYRIGLERNGKLASVFLAIKESAKRGPHLLIPGGPLMDWSDKKLVQQTFSEIKKLGQAKGAWFVRVRPETLDTPQSRLTFSKMGLLSAPIHLHAENTWVLDISKTEEELLSGMRKTTRYLVRKSLKSGLTCVLADKSEINHLVRLQQETVLRHGFVGFSEKLLSAQLTTFGSDDQAELFLCKKANEVLAAAIILYYGDTAYYHHSGSTSKYKNIPFSYFLQWNIIKEAQKRSLKYYNFWGVAPNDDPKHRFAGVTLFKKGFGGTQINWLHAQDMPLAPLYYFTRMFEMARKKIRHL